MTEQDAPKRVKATLHVECTFYDDTAEEAIAEGLQQIQDKLAEAFPAQEFDGSPLWDARVQFASTWVGTEGVKLSNTWSAEHPDHPAALPAEGWTTPGAGGPRPANDNFRPHEYPVSGWCGNKAPHSPHGNDTDTCLGIIWRVPDEPSGVGPHTYVNRHGSEID